MKSTEQSFSGLWVLCTVICLQSTPTRCSRELQMKSVNYAGLKRAFTKLTKSSQGPDGCAKKKLK